MQITFSMILVRVAVQYKTLMVTAIRHTHHSHATPCNEDLQRDDGFTLKI